MYSETPLLSVICTTYNHESYIKQALDGFVMQQCDFPIEIIVHDDASTDNTVAIIKEYAAKYPFFKTILQTENQYSKGFHIWYYLFTKVAQGKYIALCEGDDYWTDPNKLQKQVDFLETHKDTSMCFHDARIFNAEGDIKRTYQMYNQNQYALIEDIILGGGGGFCPTASMVFRAKYIKSGYPDYCLNCHVGDYPLQLYLSAKGKIFYINEKMSSYRKHTGGWSQNFSKSGFSKIAKGWLSVFITLDGINALFNYKYASTITQYRENSLFGQVILPHRNKIIEIKKIFSSYIAKFHFKAKIKFFLICHAFFFYRLFSKLFSLLR